MGLGSGCNTPYPSSVREVKRGSSAGDGDDHEKGNRNEGGLKDDEARIE
jgi:hypothetical protein